MRPNVWAVREAGLLLFGFCPETQPPEQGAELVAQVPVTTHPGASVARAGVRVITFRVEPAAPPPKPSRAAPAAGSALRLEWHSQPEPHQGRVLPVKEEEAVLRRGDSEPHASPNSRAILHPSPVLG